MFRYIYLKSRWYTTFEHCEFSWNLSKRFWDCQTSCNDITWIFSSSLMNKYTHFAVRFYIKYKILENLLATPTWRYTVSENIIRTLILLTFLSWHAYELSLLKTRICDNRFHFNIECKCEKHVPSVYCMATNSELEMTLVIGRDLYSKKMQNVWLPLLSLSFDYVRKMNTSTYLMRTRQFIRYWAAATLQRP